MNNPIRTSLCARARHAFASACVLICAALANVAFASPCPPGYHGTAPHCMPDQARTHHPYATTTGHHFSGATPLGSSKPSPTQAKIADWHKTGPSIGPAPVEHNAGTANKHGIIFVGGKTSLNPQPIPPGKTALNPQPIPPGHAASVLPHPGIKKKNAAEPRPVRP